MVFSRRSGKIITHMHPWQKLIGVPICAVARADKLDWSPVNIIEAVGYIGSVYGSRRYCMFVKNRYIRDMIGICLIAPNGFLSNFTRVIGTIDARNYYSWFYIIMSDNKIVELLKVVASIPDDGRTLNNLDQIYNVKKIVDGMEFVKKETPYLVDRYGVREYK